jgi:hypothetical protein
VIRASANFYKGERDFFCAANRDHGISCDARRKIVTLVCTYSRSVVCVNGKGVIVYPNPLVADLMVSGIADRIALLQNHRVKPNAEVLTALARLESELDDFADAVMASIELLEGRCFAPAHGASQRSA